jgi:hypothetical protein
MLCLDVHGVFDHAASRSGSRCVACDGCCLPPIQTGSARGSSVFGARSPGPPMPHLRVAVRLATYHARLKVRIESLLLFCRLFIPYNMPVHPGALASLRRHSNQQAACRRRSCRCRRAPSQLAAPTLDFPVRLRIVGRCPDVCHARNADELFEVLGDELRQSVSRWQKPVGFGYSGT